MRAPGERRSGLPSTVMIGGVALTAMTAGLDVLGRLAHDGLRRGGRWQRRRPRQAGRGSSGSWCGSRGCEKTKALCETVPWVSIELRASNDAILPERAILAIAVLAPVARGWGGMRTGPHARESAGGPLVPATTTDAGQLDALEPAGSATAQTRHPPRGGRARPAGLRAGCPGALGGQPARHPPDRPAAGARHPRALGTRRRRPVRARRIPAGRVARRPAHLAHRPHRRDQWPAATDIRARRCRSRW